MPALPKMAWTSGGLREEAWTLGPVHLLRKRVAANPEHSLPSQLGSWAPAREDAGYKSFLSRQHPLRWVCGRGQAQTLCSGSLGILPFLVPLFTLPLHVLATLNSSHFPPRPWSSTVLENFLQLWERLSLRHPQQRPPAPMPWPCHEQGSPQTTVLNREPNGLAWGAQGEDLVAAHYIAWRPAIEGLRAALPSALRPTCSVGDASVWLEAGQGQAGTLCGPDADSPGSLQRRFAFDTLLQ